MGDSRFDALSEEDKVSSEQTDRVADEDEPEGGPAFPFDADDRWSIYPREETKEDFEDAVELEVVRQLREHGIRDLQQREAHDAMVRLAAENPAGLTDRILEAREQS